MAIEKDYLTTYGWTAKNAYFKIDQFKIKDENAGLYEMTFFIYMNRQNRDDYPDRPLVRNRIIVRINREIFDNNLSEDDNLKIQGYNFLKQNTKSFQKNSIDV